MLPYFHYPPKVYNILFKITKKHVKHIATVLYLQTVATCFTCPICIRNLFSLGSNQFITFTMDINNFDLIVVFQMFA